MRLLRPNHFTSLLLVLSTAVTGCGGDIVLGTHAAPDMGTADGGTESGPGAGDDPEGCPQFVVGTDLSNVDFGASASLKADFGVFAQAVSDLSVAVTADIKDLTQACKGIAVDLGASAADQAAANALTGSSAATKWCALATTEIAASFGPSGKFATAGSVVITADSSPSTGCQSSVAVWAACRARCEPGGACDLKANPPSCMGSPVDALTCSGTITGGCMVTSLCQESCDVTVFAKPTCTARPVQIALTAMANVSPSLKTQLAAAVLSLQTNLPSIFRVIRKSDAVTGLATAISTLSTDPLSAEATRCAVVIGTSFTVSAKDDVAVQQAAASVVAAVQN